METWGIRQGLNSHLNPHKLRPLLLLTCWKRVQIACCSKSFWDTAIWSTTQIYTHLNFQHLAEVYDQAHPLEQNEKNKQSAVKNRRLFNRTSKQKATFW